MIHAFGSPDPPVPRLIAALAARGHEVGASAQAGPPERATLVLGASHDVDLPALGVLLGAWRKARDSRVLVLSALGAHPDARAPRLQRLWALEENARATVIPVLTLRLAPLIGPSSPLWLKLRSRPRLPRDGRQLLHPVAEADVINSLERALDGRAKWEGWYEVAGPEVVSLRELAELAAATGPRLHAGAGAWEPPLEELAEQRLSEAGPWLEHFQLTPRPIAERATEWAA